MIDYNIENVVGIINKYLQLLNFKDRYLILTQKEIDKAIKTKQVSECGLFPNISDDAFLTHLHKNKIPIVAYQIDIGRNRNKHAYSLAYHSSNLIYHNWTRPDFQEDMKVLNQFINLVYSIPLIIIKPKKAARIIIPKPELITEIVTEVVIPKVVAPIPETKIKTKIALQPKTKIMIKPETKINAKTIIKQKAKIIIKQTPKVEVKIKPNTKTKPNASIKVKTTSKKVTPIAKSELKTVSKTKSVKSS